MGPRTGRFPIKDDGGTRIPHGGNRRGRYGEKHAEEALKEADRRKDEFLATLAHELRNPLAPIRNAVELMRQADGDPPRDGSRPALIMERQLGHMVRLIDDLLEVSRITRGKLQLRSRAGRAGRGDAQAVETTRPLIEAAGHELTVNLPAEPVFSMPTRRGCPRSSRTCSTTRPSTPRRAGTSG